VKFIYFFFLFFFFSVNLFSKDIYFLEASKDIEVYKCRSFNCKVSSKIKKNEIFQSRKKRKDFYFINNKYHRGWVHSEGLKLKRLLNTYYNIDIEYRDTFKDLSIEKDIDYFISSINTQKKNNVLTKKETVHEISTPVFEVFVTHKPYVETKHFNDFLNSKDSTLEFYKEHFFSYDKITQYLIVFSFLYFLFILLYTFEFLIFSGLQKYI